VSSSFNAFNYDRQCWVSGEEAVELRTKQLRKELEILTGPVGQQYADFLQLGRESAVVSAQRELAELERMAGCSEQAGSFVAPSNPNVGIKQAFPKGRW